MSYTSLIYWIIVSDHVNLILGIGSIIFTVIFVIALFGFFFYKSGEMNLDHAINYRWRVYTGSIALTLLLGWALLPSKKEALIILAAGNTLDYLSSDSTARQIPKDVFNYVSVELKALTSDLNIKNLVNDQKEEILKDAKKLSSEQLIEKMKEDTNFAKIILK